MTTHRWTPVKVAKVWLDIVLAFGGVATVLLLLWLVVSPWKVRGGMPADASAAVAIGAETLLPRLPLQFSSDAAEFSSANLVWGYAELRAATTDWRLHLASMGFTAVASVIILYAIWLLREVVRETLSGRPFAPENTRRLRRLGWIVLALSAAAPVGEYLLSQAMLQRLTVESLPLSPALRLPRDAILLGLLFLVLSAVFQHGTALEEERSLTV